MATCGKLMNWLAVSYIRFIGHDQEEVWVLCSCYELSLPCASSCIIFLQGQGCPQPPAAIEPPTAGVFAGEKPPAVVKPPMAGEQPPAAVELL